jgi:hypothetical protein
MQGDLIMPNVTLGRCLTALAIVALAACSGQSPGGSDFAPAAAPATSSTTAIAATTASSPGLRSLFQHLGGPIADAKCPGRDIACLAVSYGYAATYYFCFIPSGSYCIGGQFSWSSTIRNKAGKVFKGLSGTFYPNPGDPSTDYINETRPLASSHGKVKYEQTIYACLSSGCEGPYHIGIITE